MHAQLHVQRASAEPRTHPPTPHAPNRRPRQGTTSNGKCLMPFKTGAFLAGLPVQPVIIKYGKSPISPAWESISAIRHLLLMLTQPFHSVTCYMVRARARGGRGGGVTASASP